MTHSEGNANRSTWEIDLEMALRQNCSATTINQICKGRAIPRFFRAEVWQICLGVQDKGTQLLQCNKTFGLGLLEHDSLDEQNDLQNDCQNNLTFQSYNNEDEKEAALLDLVTIIKFHLKSNNIQYEKENGWLEILSPLLALKLYRVDTYNLFQAIMLKFIPTISENNKTPFHLFRLILLYHDPELCSFLDTKQIYPESYCLTWFKTLLAANCSLVVILEIWDFYFMKSDPFLIFFFALVLIFTAKEKILAMKSDNQQKIVDMIISLPGGLKSDDIPDFCLLAQYYANRTPHSFKTELSNVLFHSVKIIDDYDHILCLPVNIEELIKTNEKNTAQEEYIRLFLIDCRPAQQYNAGHLPTAYHLDCNIMLQKPAVFTIAVQELLAAQRYVADNRRHLCFLGCGNNQQDQYLNMVVASFLHKNTQYVSILAGGYQSIHEHFIKDLSSGLIDHHEHNCLVCIKEHSSSETTKLTATACVSTQVIKKIGELTSDFINLHITESFDHSNQMKHVSRDKSGKPYRNSSSIFGIDEDMPEVLETHGKYEKHEVISKLELLRKCEAKASFYCLQVTSRGPMHTVSIVLLARDILVLRDIVGQNGLSMIANRRSYCTIKKVSCRKKQPELIRIAYGYTMDGKISDGDTFLMRNKKEATELVQYIIKQLE